MNDLDVIDPREPIDAQATLMATACETSGFFRVPLDVIDRGVADRAWNAAIAFFAQPIEVKRVVEFPEPGYPYGWSPYRFETLARSVDGAATAADLKESLSVGPDCSGVAPASEAGNWIRSPSLWPDEPADLKPAWTAYYRALAGVAESLMSIMAVALDLPGDYFEPFIDRPITSMRAIHYPALDPDLRQPDTSSIRAGAHSDYGTLTILRTSDVSGLEIQDAVGGWHAVPPDPDTFVVNLGDSIAQWTNERWRSTMHRVTLADTSRSRQSFAFFHMANWDATIECLPTCRPDDGQPRHAPVQAGPWLMRKFQSTVTSEDS